ncbi:hypothetical protein AB0F72_04295 [Actinoplanes sp. NPDC023936]|uniref:hypothetical protein n=1 Tax=Actinoplanes sp. NPDC023936 TaxID=3154910 RepID=UPI0033D135E7
MPDRIEELFADLRAETLPTVMPPGTGPLRRAARRRRSTLAAAAAVAVLAVTGLVAVVRPDASVPVATPAGPPAPLPVAATTERVAMALGIGDPERPEPGGITFFDGGGRLGTTRDLLGGRYDVKMVCFGTGSINVTIGSTPATVGCDTAQTTVLTVPLTVAEPRATVTIAISPQVDQAVFGYLPVLADGDQARYQQEAVAMLPDSGALSTMSSYLAHSEAAQDSTAEPGRYRIRAACVGYGSATLTVGRSPEGAVPVDPKTVKIRCGTTASLTYDLPARGLYTALEPDADAYGRSAGAIRVEKL